MSFTKNKQKQLKSYVVIPAPHQVRDKLVPAKAGSRNPEISMKWFPVPRLRTSRTSFTGNPGFRISKRVFA